MTSLGSIALIVVVAFSTPPLRSRGRSRSSRSAARPARTSSGCRPRGPCGLDVEACQGHQGRFRDGPGLGRRRNIIAAGKARRQRSRRGVQSDMVALSRRLAAEAVSPTGEVRRGDIRGPTSRKPACCRVPAAGQHDRLAPKFLAWRPARASSATRSASTVGSPTRALMCGHRMRILVRGAVGIVPARVHGTWAWPGGTLVLEQLCTRS